MYNLLILSLIAHLMAAFSALLHPAPSSILHPAPGFWLLASVNCDHSLHCTVDTDFWMVIQYSILYTVSVYTLIYITSGLKRPCTYSETELTTGLLQFAGVCVY